MGDQGSHHTSRTSKGLDVAFSTTEIETFEGAGHLLFFEAPKAVGRLGSFLAK